MSDETLSYFGNGTAILFGSLGAVLSDPGAIFSVAVAGGGLVFGAVSYLRGQNKEFSELRKQLHDAETALQKAIADLLAARTELLETTQRLVNLEERNERLMEEVERLTATTKTELDELGERLADR